MKLNEAQVENTRVGCTAAQETQVGEIIKTTHRTTRNNT